MTIIDGCLIFSTHEIATITETINILYKIPDVIKDKTGCLNTAREVLVDVLDALECVEVKAIELQ